MDLKPQRNIRDRTTVVGSPHAAMTPPPHGAAVDTNALLREVRRRWRARRAVKVLPALLVMLGTAVFLQLDWWLIAPLGAASLWYWRALPRTAQA